MKVLTIKEPYATLIMKGLKKIKTRSWKTNYRGKIYIHAGKSKDMLKSIINNEVLNLIKNENLNFGNIICKAKLTDCVYMTPEFITKLKEENKKEFLLGKYEVGRYAWVLENIEILKDKIPAKGKLNIWDYKISTK